MHTERDTSLTDRGWVEIRTETEVTFRHSSTNVGVTFRPENQVLLRIRSHVSTYDLDLQCEARATYLDRLSRVMAREERRMASRIAELALGVEELCTARQYIDPIPWQDEDVLTSDFADRENGQTSEDE